MANNVYSVTLFDGASGGPKDGTIAAGQYIESDDVEVNSMRPIGQFASHFKVAGDGTVDVDLYVSINGTDFVLSRNLFEDQTAGEILESHGFEVCLKFRVRVTETGGADGVVVSHWMGVQ